jgi:hypothetical protein
MLPLAFRLRALARPATSTTSTSSRELSVSAGRLGKLDAHKKKRITPQRKIFHDREVPRQKTDEQLEWVPRRLRSLWLRAQLAHTTVADLLPPFRQC